ncbi:MAG TPA: hypothetical protein PK573_01415 [Spirochaetota bacterium]|nr:hypothetical protein [Spirochaetota bacterium]
MISGLFNYRICFMLPILLILLLSPIVTCDSGSDKKDSATTQTIVDNIPNLGSVDFNVDAENTVTGLIGPADASLTVTDSQGIVWQLDIPGNDLYDEVPVTMAPLTNVSMDSDTLNVSCGVKLGPDGFSFIEPATLTVTLPENITAEYLFYLAKDDGSKLMFAETTKTGDRTYQITLNHFTIPAGGEDPGIAARGNLALKNYNNTVTEIKEFLKYKKYVMPEPPGISNLCKDKPDTGTAEGAKQYGERLGLLNDYYKAAFPEILVFEALQEYKRQLDLTGTTYDEDKALYYLCELNYRSQKKVKTLLSTYIKKEDKYIAVNYVTMKVINIANLYDCEGASAQVSAVKEIFNMLANYITTCRKYWYEQLLYKSDLEAYWPAMEFNRQLSLCGEADDGFIEKLEKAMTFDVETYLFTYTEAEKTTEIQITGTTKIQWHLPGGAKEFAVLNVDKAEQRHFCGDHQAAIDVMNNKTIDNIVYELKYDPCSETEADKIYLVSALTFGFVENWKFIGDDCENEYMTLVWPGPYPPIPLSHALIGNYVCGTGALQGKISCVSTESPYFAIKMDLVKDHQIAHERFVFDFVGNMIYSVMEFWIYHNPQD